MNPTPKNTVDVAGTIYRRTMDGRWHLITKNGYFERCEYDKDDLLSRIAELEAEVEELMETKP